jgi:7,8-dihydropterin-6-yl-methyl-4-(beta-D-ribofuranosyl)aminobenzene 5'-phosphate synthase
MYATITIIYDNNRHDPRLRTDWGFSCLVRGLDMTILFDTGGDGQGLLYNMDQLGIDPADVDAVILSHIHSDHTGGLIGFLEKNKDATVYLPSSFPEEFKKAAGALGAEVQEVHHGMEIFPGVYTTGELGDRIREQSLILTAGEGLVVVTGCAHPGILEVVEKAKEVTGKKSVCLLLGGYHLEKESKWAIASLVQELRKFSVVKVAACHCTGDSARILLMREYGPNCIQVGGGNTLTLPLATKKAKASEGFDGQGLLQDHRTHQYGYG